MQNKRGISLIVLIITIVVIVILAATVIVSLVNSDIIGKAKEARFKSDVANIKEALNLIELDAIIKGEDEADYSGILKSPYDKIFKIKDGVLYYIGENEREQAWVKDLDVAKGENVPDDWIDISLTTPENGISLLVGKPADTNATVTFKVTIAGTYTVEWGDGNIDTSCSSGVETTHTYNSNDKGTLSEDGYLFQVNIKPETGNITEYRTIASSSSKNTSILWCEIGCDTLTSCESMLQYSSNLKKFGTRSTDKLSNVINMYRMFMGCSNLEKIPLFDTSKVTSMSNMFNGCSSLKTIPELETSKVTDMGTMFYKCSSLETIPLLNTNKVIYMNQMFCRCNSLKEIPLFDTKNVTTMSNMFTGCSSLKSIPELNTSSTTNMSYMFSECTNLETIPKLDTINVEDMNYMFFLCSSLTTITHLDTSKVTNMSNMFIGCSSLSSISIANTYLDATKINNAFYALPKISNGGTIDITGNLGISGCDRTIATGKGWTVIP